MTDWSIREKIFALTVGIMNFFREGLISMVSRVFGYAKTRLSRFRGMSNPFYHLHLKDRSFSRRRKEVMISTGFEASFVPVRTWMLGGCDAAALRSDRRRYLSSTARLVTQII